MKKCKFGRCTDNCKNPSMCAQVKKFVGYGCSLAITEQEYQRRKSGGNIIYGKFGK